MAGGSRNIVTITMTNCLAVICNVCCDAGFGEKQEIGLLAFLVGSMHGTPDILAGSTTPTTHVSSPWSSLELPSYTRYVT